MDKDETVERSPEDDEVDEELEETFPASDAPAQWAGRDHERDR